MGEISSETMSVSVENYVSDHDSDEINRTVLGKEVLADQAHSDDQHVNGENQDDQGQQIFHQGDGGDNTLLAPQEIPGNPDLLKVDGVVCDGVEVKVKPKLTVTKGIRPRLRWNSELHSYFVDVCNQLGGPYKATPKTVLDMMDIDGLSLKHVKSHLQKYRLGKCPENQLCNEAGKTGNSDSHDAGSSSSGSPLNSVPSRTNQRNRSHRAKRNPKNSTKGDLYLKLEAGKRAQRCMEAQRRYLRTAVERACQKLANQYIADGAMQNAVLYGQASASVGNFTTIPPAGPSGFGTTTTTTVPPFYFNQQNAYATYNTPATPTNFHIQQPPFGYQPQTSAFHPASQDNFPTAYGYPGPASSSYQETSPAPADNTVWPADEDSLYEVFFNWDDNEPRNLDDV